MNYLELIKTERSWSWAAIVLAALILGLCIRHLALRNIFIKMKQMPLDLRKRIEKDYEKRSLVGWLLFLIAMALVGVLWSLPQKLVAYSAIATWQLAVLFILGASFFSHTRAYLHALFNFIQEKIGSERA
jgi:hypothetical protein